MDFLIEKAYAKINLYLDVIDKREDGYHNILSIMQNISLHDKIRITKTESLGFEFLCSDKTLEACGKSNLACRAADLFLKRHPIFDHGIKIELEKNIPIAAGMAGGSSDAAAVLRGLNKLYNEPFSQKELCEMGKSLGADVPFCITGGACITEGIGEKLRKCKGLNNCYIVIGCGNDKIMTPMAYKALDEKFNDFQYRTCGKGFERLLEHLEDGDLEDASPLMYNIFEEISKDVKSVSVIKNVMMTCGAAVSMMSGSGPSVFGVFRKLKDAETAQRELDELGIYSSISEPIN